MTYVVLHCPNWACGHRIWVPTSRLGSRARCSECGHVVQTPAHVPADQYVEGPDIVAEADAAEPAVPVGQA